MNNQAQILTEIVGERIRQDKQWGGAQHDDTHPSYEWEDLIKNHARRLTVSAPAPGHDQIKHGAYRTVAAKDYRERLIRIAALAVAAIEAHDRHLQALEHASNSGT